MSFIDKDLVAKQHPITFTHAEVLTTQYTAYILLYHCSNILSVYAHDLRFQNYTFESSVFSFIEKVNTCIAVF